MTKEKYLEICIKFAKDTKNWTDLNHMLHYTTYLYYEWIETSDNAHGGIDVRWAFHKPISYIKKHYKEMLDKRIREDLQVLIDDECDYEQIYNYFENLID